MALSSINYGSKESPRRVVILANPLAGTHTQPYPLTDLVSGLRSRGLEPTLCWDREALPERLREINGGVRCIIAAGGDGTIQEVVNRAPGSPVSILPLGNENLLARYFHFQASGDRLAEVIARPQVRQLDLGNANGRYFSLMASAGFDAHVVHGVHRSRLGHINKLSYVGPLLRAVQDYSFPIIDVQIPESGESLHGAMVFVFNVPEYGLRIPLAPMARADDGWLDLLVFEKPGVTALGRYLDLVIRGKHLATKGVHHRRIKRVLLSSARPAPLQIDGDPAGFLPAAVEVAPGSLELLTPGS